MLVYQRVAVHFLGKVVMFDAVGGSGSERFGALIDFLRHPGQSLNRIFRERSTSRMNSGNKLIRPTGSIFLPGPPGIASLWNHPWDVANAAGGPCRCMTDAWHFPRASCCRNWWRERSLMVMAHTAASPRSPPPRMKRVYPWFVASGTAAKVQKLEKSIGQDLLCSWTSEHLSRVYPRRYPHQLRQCGSHSHVAFGCPDGSLELSKLLIQVSCWIRDSSDTTMAVVAMFWSHHSSLSIRSATKLWLRICCGHRLPRPDEPGTAEVSSPMVSVALHPGGQVSQTPAVQQDGYHPVFNHSVVLEISDSALHILTFEAPWLQNKGLSRYLKISI